MRQSGVLMPVFSLPSKYGIGVFNDECIHFADRLAQMNFRYWQVLPFNPVDGSNSPYCSSSAFAGNYMFIDPETLLKDGLCTEEEYRDNVYGGSPYTADYEFAGEKRLKLLKNAFLRITPELAQSVKNFEKENAWLTDFSLYMSLKEFNGMKPWWEWSEEQARYETFIKKHRYDFEERSAFWKFVQYIFFSQWKKVKSYIKETTKKLKNLESVINMRNGNNCSISLLQNLWLTGDKSINKLFYIDNRAALMPNYAAVYKLQALLDFYKEALEKIYNPDAYIKLLLSWIPSKSLDNAIYLDSSSGENIQSIDEFIECYENKILKPNSIYDEFMRIYKNECYMKYSKEEFDDMMNIKKAKNIRKATINHALEKLGKPYKIFKIKKCWVLLKLT